ncbi:hypothetical protein [Chryseobacterium paludis]|uniref:hypothetical protein n=1 Tax=Chryseobacterium paludis TaxID=2956784 RepID=UPI0021BE2499|nr:hypothetical protein [Chryseobacterium paludis]
MKLLVFILSSILLLNSCLGDYDAPPPEIKKSTKYFVYKSLTRKNNIVTFTVIHEGTCTAKSYYEITQPSDATFVSYSTCDHYTTQKGTFGNGSMIFNGVIYNASIKGDELTVSQFNTVMGDTYEEITIAKRQ